jgi:hypothetical protein
MADAKARFGTIGRCEMNSCAANRTALHATSIWRSENWSRLSDAERSRPRGVSDGAHGWLKSEFPAGFVSNNNEVLDTIRKLALKMCKHKTEEANKK